MKSIGFILSGAGFQDGTEIQEAVLAMTHLQKAGCRLHYISIDKAQTRTVDHQTGSEVSNTRNTLAESARISRDQVTAATDIDPNTLDGIVIPGGFGAALNLCDFAVKGPDMSVDPDIAQLIHKTHESGKPIAAICIAPALIARTLGEKGVRFTIGMDQETADALQTWGAKHVACDVDDCVVDKTLKVVTTPAYMLGQSAAEIDVGIGKLVTAFVGMLND